MSVLKLSVPFYVGGGSRRKVVVFVIRVGNMSDDDDETSDFINSEIFHQSILFAD